MAKTADKLVNEWMAEVEIARFFRQKNFLTDWNYWEQVYDDKLWGSRVRKSRGRDKTTIPQVNELETIILTIVPNLWFTDPVFEVTADDDEWAFSALVWEKMAEVIMSLDVVNMRNTIRENIVDCLILGGGVIKLGYSYELEESGYTLGDGTAGEPFIRDEMVVAGYVSPKKMLWDYNAVRWGDARWFIEEIDKPVEEVKKNKIYSNTKDLNGNKNSQLSLIGSRKYTKEKNNDIVTLLEIHDLVNGKIITLAEDHPKVLRNDDDYGMVLYENLQFAPSRPMKIWGKSIVQSIEEHVIRLSKNHYYMDSHSRRGGLSKWVADKARFDTAAKKGLESSRDFELILIDGDPNSAIVELKSGGVSMDWFVTTNLIEETIRMLSGVTMQERGKHETGVQTAYETAKLFEASDARNKDRLLQLNEFVRCSMTKILGIVSSNWPLRKVAELTGLKEQYVPFLQPFDKMKLNVKYGSTALASRLEKRESLLGFANVMAAAGVQLDPRGFGKMAADAFGMDWNDRLVLFGEAGGGAGGGSASAAASPARPGVGSINAQVK